MTKQICDQVSVYNAKMPCETDGVELSTRNKEEQQLMLVGRNGEGKTTFVLLLKTQLVADSNSIRIASIDMLKAPKDFVSDTVVAVVSNEAKV
jgi:ABC-type Na+ transport system ATPase subunit NatA